MPSLLSIGASALNAADVGLRVTGHNIANVNTKGFARQQAVQTTPDPQFMGTGYIGRGVSVDTVRRLYDGFLNAQGNQSTARAAEMATRSTRLDLVDQILGATDAGIPAALDGFFSALDVANNHPADLAARQSAVSAGAALVAQFNDVASRLADLRRAVEMQVGASLGDVNQALQDVASINREIAHLQGTQQPPNDLLDKRDAIVRSLSEKLGVTSVMQENGSMSLFTGNGQALVLNGNAATLVTQRDPYDPQRTQVGIRLGQSFSYLESSSLNGGSLAGMLKFADQDLALAQDEIGRLALAAGSALNAQHRAGVTLSGAAGGDIFGIGGFTPAAATSNAGTGALGATITDATALAASGYRVSWDGSQYAVTRLSDGTVTNSATLPLAVDGLTFTMAGAPAPGDSFVVNAVRDAATTMTMSLVRPEDLALASPSALTGPAGDNTNGLAMTALARASLLGGMSLAETAAGLYGSMGIRAESARAGAGAQAAVRDQVIDAESSVSGVNLDEEAARLIQYQQAYQAAAKIIATAQTLFDTLLGMSNN